MRLEKARFSFNFRVFPGLFFAFFHGLRLFASLPDSSQPVIPTRIISFTEYQWKADLPGEPWDTGFSELNEPDPVVQQGGQHLGVIGSAARNLFGPFKSSIFTWTGLTATEPWITRPENVKYYRTNKRLTRLDYHMGSFREQSIEAFHSQNIIRNWNAGLRFRRFNVKDFLPRSDPYYNRFLFFTDYESQDGRYHIFANAMWNSLRNQLNGGITYDTIFSGKETSNIDLK
ncbi:MAG: putative porin, partial [Bacteroidota bacterium]